MLFWVNPLVMAKLQGIGKRRPKPPGEKLSPEQATRAAVATIVGSLGEIVDAMIRQATGGSHLHAKLLFDLAGISAASLPPETGTEESSLTRLLMEKLDQMAEETAAAEDKRPVE
jgi:hypothetical protein